MAGHLAASLHVGAGRLFVGLWALVVLGLALPSWALRTAAEATLAALMALALLKASPHIRVLATVLLGLTLLLTLHAGSLDPIERGLRAALAVGAFLPVIALVRVTVLASPTVPAIRERVGAMTDPERRAWMTGGAHLLGAILMMGYVAVLRPLLAPSIDPDQRRVLAECGARGLGLAVVWSPFFVASAVAGQLVPGVPAWQTVVVGLVLAALGGAIANRMFNPSIDLHQLARTALRLRPIGLPTLLLVGVVVATGALTGWSALQSVIVVVPVVCAAYLVGFAPAAARRALPEVAAVSGRMGDEVLILSASTVFGAAIAGFAMPDGITQTLQALGGQPWLVIALSVMTITGLGIAGLHPMVSASVVVPTCLALGLPIAPVVLAQVVVLSWALSAMVSAWTLPVVVTAGAFDVPVRRLVFGPNLRFVAVFGAAAIVALAMLNALWLR